MGLAAEGRMGIEPISQDCIKATVLPLNYHPKGQVGVEPTFPAVILNISFNLCGDEHFYFFIIIFTVFIIKLFNPFN